MTSLSKSVFRLQLLQLAALALPLAIQPWLAQHLGPFEYGRLLFVAALTAYLVLFCDFGFGWSATRQIAVHREDARKCSELVCATLLAKALLFVAGLVILLLLIALVGEFRKEAGLLLASYMGVLGTVLSPSWYFQGTERPHIALLADILGRGVAIPIVLVYVTAPGDLTIAVVALAAGQLVGGLWAFVLLLREPQVHWIAPRWRDVINVVWRGVPLFLSTSAVSLYTAASGLVLGLVSTREQVAYFGAAQKIIAAGSTVLNPFNQVFYPRVSHQMRHDPPAARRLVSVALLWQAAAGLLLSAGLWFLSDQLAVLLFGPAFAHAALCLRWMAAVPFLLAVASVFANLVILPLRRDGLHVAMTVGAAVLHIAILVPLARTQGAVGASIALLVSEAFVMLYAAVVGGALLRRVRQGAEA